MTLRCILSVALLAATLGSSFGQDATSLLQSSMSASLHASFSQAVNFNVGENVQMKFSGEIGWVDCTISATGNMPDSYNVQVPSREDRIFSDVPVSNLRKVYRGFEVNIDNGDENVSTWVPCMLTAKTGNRYTAELLDYRPGLVLEAVPPELLRESAERLDKARNFREMIQENEAQKRDLFYTAQLKPNRAKFEAEVQKMKQAEEDTRFKYMQSYVWQEMAQRAEKEENNLKEKEQKEVAAKQARETSKTAKKKARVDAIIAEQEAKATSDPVAALMVKARTLKEANAKSDSKLGAIQDQATTEQRLKEEKKKLAEKRAREIEEQMKLMKQQHEELRKRAASGTLEVPDTPEMREAQENKKMFEALEMRQSRQRNMMREEFMVAEQEEESKYKEEEAKREASSLHRNKAAARAGLELALKAFNEDESQRKEKTMLALGTAVAMAGFAQMEAEEVDPARLSLVKQVTSNAREILSKAMEAETLSDVQKALAILPQKVKECDRFYKSIEDRDAKKEANPFKESEIEQLRERVPELQKSEVKFAALRARIEMAKMKTSMLREAVTAAEKGGLPSKEIEAAKAKLKEREARPLLVKNIEDAKKVGDITRLKAAIAEGEASGFVNGGVLHNARHVLKQLEDDHRLGGMQAASLAP